MAGSAGRSVQQKTAAAKKGWRTRKILAKSREAFATSGALRETLETRGAQAPGASAQAVAPFLGVSSLTELALVSNDTGAAFSETQLRRLRRRHGGRAA